MRVSFSVYSAYNGSKETRERGAPMEFILINRAKVKVMLGPDDMEKYELDSMDIDYENVHTRRAFRRILDEVKCQTGFDIASEQVLVQVYPSRDGGCEMFVTKISQTKEEGVGRMANPKEITMLSVRINGYHFTDLDDLLSVSREMKKRGYKLRSWAYRGEEGDWYLALEERVRSGTKRLMSELSFLDEYATEKRGSVRLAYIKEHSTCVIAENAVEILASLSE